MGNYSQADSSLFPLPAPVPLSLASPGLLCGPPPRPRNCPNWGTFRAGFCRVCVHTLVCMWGWSRGAEEAALRGRTEASLFIYYLWKSPSVMKLPPKGRGGKDRTLLNLAVWADGAEAGPVRQLVTGCWLPPLRVTVSSSTSVLRNYVSTYVCVFMHVYISICPCVCMVTCAFKCVHVCANVPM